MSRDFKGVTMSTKRNPSWKSIQLILAVFGLYTLGDSKDK